MIMQILSGLLGISIAFNFYFIFIIIRNFKEMKRREEIVKFYLDRFEDNAIEILKLLSGDLND